MFKITTKTTKDTLGEALRLNYQKVLKKDKNLADMISYAGAPGNNPTRTDLVDLVKDTMKLLGDAFVAPALAPVENSVKPKKSKKSKKDTPVAETPAPVKETPSEEPISEKKTKAAKKSAKKSVGKKKSTDAVTVLEGTDANDKTVQLAKMFPETLTIDGEEYVIDHEVKTIADLANGEFEFAYYWTKRHLKQFDYFARWLGQPKSFPNDLDTAQLIYVSDDNKVAYCVSDATEAVYSIFPADLEEVDGVRVATGIEFQIYRK